MKVNKFYIKENEKGASTVDLLILVTVLGILITSLLKFVK